LIGHKVVLLRVITESFNDVAAGLGEHFLLLLVVLLVQGKFDVVESCCARTEERDDFRFVRERVGGEMVGILTELNVLLH
jgi:hypothetical protein